MYTFDKRARKNRHGWRWLNLAGLVLIIVIATMGRYAHYLLPSHTNLQQAAAVVTAVKPVSTPMHTYNEGIFTLQLPNTWKQVTGETQPYLIYRWENTTTDNQEQQIEIYQDTIPLNFAVNRMLIVDANGAGVSVEGTVSDNCANFTKSSTNTNSDGGTYAIWDGVNFVCDLGNYERDVVGTSSTDGINTVTLNGPMSGSHKFFFAYTDNNIAPDYTVFTTMLGSFSLK